MENGIQQMVEKDRQMECFKMEKIMDQMASFVGQSRYHYGMEDVKLQQN